MQAVDRNVVFGPVERDGGFVSELFVHLGEFLPGSRLRILLSIEFPDGAWPAEGLFVHELGPRKEDWLGGHLSLGDLIAGFEEKLCPAIVDRFERAVRRYPVQTPNLDLIALDGIYGRVSIHASVHWCRGG